jgi:mannose-binding lectin
MNSTTVHSSSIRFGYCAAVVLALLVSSDVAAQQILYAQITTAPTMNSPQFVDIPGLSFTLPAANPAQTAALITLNVPNPYASGNDFPGLRFAINAAGAIVADGGFSYELQAPPSFGRTPITIVVRVPLSGFPQTVKAQWVSVRNSTGHIDSFASLSAIVR